MSNLPEVAQSSGLEVNNSASAPTAIQYYISPHQYEQQQQFPSKGDYMSVSDQDPPKQAATPLICGVRRSTFWLAVILAIVVIAAAVGGGVGGSIAVSNARSQTTPTTPLPARETLTITPSACIPTPTTTPTGTSDPSDAFYTPTPPRDVLRINVACPSPTISSPNAGSPVDFSCVGNKDASNNDLMWFTAYTLQACIDGCTAFNRGSGSTTDVRCRGVAIAEDLSHQAVVNSGANCWLKTSVNESEFTDSQTNTVAWLVDEL